MSKISKFTIGGPSSGNRNGKRFEKRSGPLSSLAKKLKNVGSGGLREYLSLWPYVLILLFLAGSLTTLGLYVWVRKDLPDPNRIVDRSVAESSRIYDRTGETILYEVHGDQKRTLVELDQISPYVKKATIVAEDRDFYDHKGYKITGYLRALWSNIKTGGRGQGGSTITQQLVKNALLSPEKTYTRKLKELLLSVQIERNFDKDTILKMYLNEIPYGSVIYGIESAAESFFGKKAADLDLAESALLAALPQSTSYLSPYGIHVDQLLARQRWIIDSMTELGYVSQEEADEAKERFPDEKTLRENVRESRASITAPHFVLMVRQEMIDKFGEQLVERGGLKITTTLDAEFQTAAEDSIRDNLDLLERYDASNAALLSYDPTTGDILSMVGSADYFNDEISGQYNVLTGLRQPGSSIKPIVYSSLFEQGYTPNTVLFDAVTNFGGYTPQNYDFSERGPVTVRQALAGSLNVPAVKALYLAGLNNTIQLAGRLGYTTFGDRDRFGLSLALGGAEVRPLEHIAAFSAFPNDGRRISLRNVLKVEDRGGKVLLDNTENIESHEVLSVQVARQITSILSDNSARSYVFGENSYLNLPRPAGAKTGTTNGYKDAWTIGFTPNLVTGVWVGNSNGQEMRSGAGGSQVAAPIWNAYMRRTLENLPVMNFTPPEPVQTGKPILDGEKTTQAIYRIDTVSGLLATDHTPEELVEERGYGLPHSTLYFIDRRDPRGPAPKNPEQDPMFANWEAAVARWAESQGLETEDFPPTEFDNLHTAEDVPQVTLIRPLKDETVSNRNMYVELDASSRRGISHVEFSIDGDHFGTLYGPPFSGTVTVPNRFSKGYHVLSATALDDVENRKTVSTTFNLTAESGPIGVQWKNPRHLQTVSSNQFPLDIRFGVEDITGMTRIHLESSPVENQNFQTIGTIENPALPNMSIVWNERPSKKGKQILRLTAEFDDGHSGSEEIEIEIR